MHHFPVDTAIWIVLLVIGVVSSIVSKTKKAIAKSDRVRSRPAMRVQPALDTQRQQLSSVLAQAMAAVAPAPEAPPVVVAAKPVKRAPPPEPRAPLPSAAAAAPAPAHGTPPFRGMFERGNLVRAIVAAEVLGPPKALQEQSIWSPRHSEPSI